MSLYQELKKFSQKDRVSFHIPGHKGGEGLSSDWKKDAFSLDVTEFDETDDLQNPQGILKAAEENAAKIFGSGKSFFLTGGSTLGLEAAMLASVRPGDKVLLDRTCHKAVANALVLTGGEPVFLSPEFDRGNGVYLGISPDAVADILEQEPNVTGMVLTSPTYYGICSDIERIAEVLHQKGKFLIVDEAHGAHFVFSKQLPKTALLQGADICIQSAHKTLPALGQTSLLHLGKKSLISPQAVQSALRILMTTSPSYLLMSALDESISFMENQGAERLAERIEEISALKEKVKKKGVITFLDKETIEKEQDATRVVADVRKTGLSGYQVAEQLKEKFGIYPEMADDYHLVLVVSVSNTKEDLKRLEEALLSYEEKAGEQEKMLPLPMPKMGMNPREAYMAPREKLPLQKAKGRISADVVSVCPPGAAMILPGQWLDEETLHYCEKAGVAEELFVIVK